MSLLTQKILLWDENEKLNKLSNSLRGMLTRQIYKFLLKKIFIHGPVIELLIKEIRAKQCVIKHYTHTYTYCKYKFCRMPCVSFLCRCYCSYKTVMLRMSYLLQICCCRWCYVMCMDIKDLIWSHDEENEPPRQRQTECQN